MNKQESSHTLKSKSLWASFIYFFPLQLLILHFKKNHLLLFFWFLLFGYVSGGLATKYGVSYLFLYPEYLGTVGFWSHFMVGAALGGFVMAFNIYSYVMHAYRFPFLATLSRPFYKFSLNNFMLPAIFIGFYVWKIIAFQRIIELENSIGIFQHILGFALGFLSFLGVSLLYFYGTNKDVFGFLKSKKEKRQGRFTALYYRFVRERSKQSKSAWNQRPWRVESYIKDLSTVVRARESEHYDEETLRRVFSQNHFNASLFEVLLVMSFLVVVNFGELPIFTIPGGASVILMFTMLIMIISVLLSWFRGWAVSVFIIIILVANVFSDSLSFLPQVNALYGLNYQGVPAEYNKETIQAMSRNSSKQSKDRRQMEAVLGNWKARQASEGKPKLLIINCSGGGLRSAMWTTSILTELDSLMEGQLMNRTALITGASGGMIGASFVREEYIQNDFENIYTSGDKMEADISKDILNPVLMSLATSDMFFQFTSFDYAGHTYPKDRAYRFEEQLLDNTGRGLDKTLGAYRDLEFKAEIPMIILYPTIINDGRKLLISPLDLGFMTDLPLHESEEIDHQFEFIEFRELLQSADADQARFSSLIRANATFPYILPQVSLPTKPAIQLMDAGIRDNFGYGVSFRFIGAMRAWIQENTSGVVLIQVRDKRKDIEEKTASQSILSRLTSPLGNVYGNFIKTQDFVHDDLFMNLNQWLQVPIDEVLLEMEHPEAASVSMSWHLTALEKKTIETSVYNADNQRALNRILRLMKTERQE